MIDNDDAWVGALGRSNFLAVLDVVLDVEEELQVADSGEDVVIPLLQPLVKFRELLPTDSVSFRDRYCELRWKAAKLLERKGAFQEVNVIQGFHRWEGRLRIAPDPTRFPVIAATVRAECERLETQPAKSPADIAPSEDDDDPLQRLRRLILRFHSVVIQLRQRREGRSTLDVQDEYDVQDLLHALLRLFFDDVRPEEWTPSHAGKSSRVDFLLKPEQIVVEAKKARPGLGAKEIGDQLITDIARYAKMTDCKRLVCMIYDPDNRIANAGGFQADLSGERDGLTVEAIVIPKQY